VVCFAGDEKHFVKTQEPGNYYWWGSTQDLHFQPEPSNPDSVMNINVIFATLLIQ
jgi:hypothetical protein